MVNFRVAVMLATHNGIKWLDSQIDSILQQRGVDVEIWVSDDSSTDGTLSLVESKIAEGKNIHVLSPAGKKLGAAGNFFRLVCDVPANECDFYAFSDQDDVWDLNKLSQEIQAINANNADGVSSDVMAFWPDGRESLVRKSYRQTNFDFLFEGPGPGCTFLMSPRLIKAIREWAVGHAELMHKVSFHDWFVYVVCRSMDWKWTILGVPTVRYRQHSSNEFGANMGIGAAWKRVKLVFKKWHREEALLMCQVALSLDGCARRDDILYILQCMSRSNFHGRIMLLCRSFGFRRRWRDKVIIALLIALGCW